MIQFSMAHKYAAWDDEGLNDFLDEQHYVITATGIACGENRLEKALTKALELPCLKSALPKACKVWCMIDYSEEHELLMSEIECLADNPFGNIDWCWWTDYNKSLGKNIKVVLLVGIGTLSHQSHRHIGISAH